MLKINTCTYPKLVLRRLIKPKKSYFIASLEKNVIAKKDIHYLEKNTRIHVKLKFLNFQHKKATGIIRI